MVLNGKLTLTETGITFVLRRENGKKYVQYSAEWCEVRRALLRDSPRRRRGTCCRLGTLLSGFSLILLEAPRNRQCFFEILLLGGI